MTQARVVVAGTGTGVGKTTIAMGLMAAFAKRNMAVQGYKVGPDYIDPGYHTRLTGRPSHNLDSWMLQPQMVRDLFARSSVDADVAVIEGVMGLYDGHDARTNIGSTADIALLLDAPVILVLDVWTMARTAAAIVLGLARMEPRLQVAGVIANRVGGAGHYALVKQAVESVCQVPMLGYLEASDALTLPERHLGLVPAIEREDFESFGQRLASQVEKTVDLDKIYDIATAARPVDSAMVPSTTPVVPKRVQIAVARDAAFNFYYEENLAQLEANGAQLCFFQPLAGDFVPDDVDGLYLGGGFPEEFARELSAQTAVLSDIRARIAAGMPTIAECGGYMALTRRLIDKHGDDFEMVGALDAEVTMQEKLQGFGYREVAGTADNFLLFPGETARGHEYHYSSMAHNESLTPAFQVLHPAGRGVEGVIVKQCVAGYTHLHFASNPQMATRFVDACSQFRARRKGSAANSEW